MSEDIRNLISLGDCFINLNIISNDYKKLERQIVNDYVSFPLAKKLKKNKFDLPCNEFYKIVKGDPIFSIIEDNLYFPMNFNNFGENIVSAPDFYIVCKWFRIKYGIYIVVKPETDIELDQTFLFDIIDTESPVNFYDTYLGEYVTSKKIVNYSTIEECYEKAIEEAIMILTKRRKEE